MKRSINLDNRLLDRFRRNGIIAYPVQGVGSQDNKGERKVPTVLIGYAYDAGVCHIRVIENTTFQFCWRDLESAHFEHFLI